MVHVVGVLHSIENYRGLYLQWLMSQGIDLRDVESGSPLGKKITRDLESLPAHQTPLDSIRSFFEKTDLRGRRVGIELPFEVEDVRTVLGSDRSKKNTSFWIELADFIESKGGTVVPLDSRSLFTESNTAMKTGGLAGMKRHDRLSFRRSVRMVEAASFPHAEFLIVGAGHSDDVKAVLGRSARVTTLVPRALRQMLVPGRRLIRAQFHRAKPLTRSRLRARLRAARKPTHF